ncbi:MAG: 2-oxo acid dehydrogenase subunit E2, partial [Propionibacteriaceae bacterium]|nr:2-oxo acid dehydrogenase subunit E2 [Propionibacteriaceae bacterium]
MYEKYRSDPGSVDESWASYFASLDRPADTGHADKGPADKGPADKGPTDRGQATGNGSSSAKPTQQGAQTSSKPESAKTPPEGGSQGRQEQSPPPQSPNQPVSGPARQPAASTPRPAATVEKGIDVKELRPVTPGKAGGLPADPPNPAHRPSVAIEEPVLSTLRGAPARTAKNMDISLSVPTATSVRSLPVKLMIDQRVVINNHLRRARGGKVSYTHLIGYAMVQALKTVPAMNNGYEVIDGKPTMVVPAHINLGLAIDLPKEDGSRQLLVPNIKSCESLDFAQFWAAYEEVVKKARGSSLTVADFAGTTITLTNPGTIGTNHSVPRLMQGQGCIIGVGSMEYPPEFQGSDPDRLSDMSVSKVMTLTSTYDHRVIQGAQSGVYLAR